MKVSTFERLSLPGRFLLFSLLVLLTGMVTIGLWIQHEIGEAVTHRTAEVTALYVNSFVSPHLQSLTETSPLEPHAVEAFDELLDGTALGRDIVAFKIWAADGTVLYSANPGLIGQNFDTRGQLAEAFAGSLVSEVSDLSKPENVYEAQSWDSLIETYTPVRLSDTGDIVAVAEFYQRPDSLLSDIRRAQVRSWLFVGAATVIMYLLLAGNVRRVGNIMKSQQDALEGNVNRLRDLLSSNKKLQDRMREAAGKTTALNEKYLHRISADLHDGPAQNVALALLRMESLGDALKEDAGTNDRSREFEDLSTVQSSLDSALADIRSIAQGLRLPEIEGLAPADTARRVIHDFERVTGKTVEFLSRDVPGWAPLPVKITIYRVLQEALANGYKHAGEANQSVTMTSDGSELSLEIVDDGPGFDSTVALGDETLGLSGMRERVEMLGGRFEVANGAGSGTTVRARLPLALHGADSD
jgi:signal transduction histidine kinase